MAKLALTAAASGIPHRPPLAYFGTGSRQKGITRAEPPVLGGSVLLVLLRDIFKKSPFVGRTVKLQKHLPHPAAWKEDKCTVRSKRSLRGQQNT